MKLKHREPYRIREYEANSKHVTRVGNYTSIEASVRTVRVRQVTQKVSTGKYFTLQWFTHDSHDDSDATSYHVWLGASVIKPLATLFLQKFPK